MRVGRQIFSDHAELNMRRNITAGWYWGLCLMVWAPPGATAQEPEEVSYEGRSAKEWAADLKDKDPKVRRAAAQACYQIWPRPKALDSVLTEALKDPDMMVRLEVANTLGLTNTQHELVLAVYRGALKDKDVTIREQAAIGLGRMYRPPKATVITLTEALQDPEMIVRLEAANSLYQISRYTAGARIFSDALKDKAPRV